MKKHQPRARPPQRKKPRKQRPSSLPARAVIPDEPIDLDRDEARWQAAERLLSPAEKARFDALAAQPDDDIRAEAQNALLTPYLAKVTEAAIEAELVRMGFNVSPNQPSSAPPTPVAAPEADQEPPLGCL